MARATSNCTSIYFFLFDGISAHIQRKVYTTAATTTEAVRQSSKVEEKVADISASSGGKQVTRSDTKKESAGTWIPDPITGYYRPVHYVANVDAAELRKTHQC
ncbi:late embryogenesis abundant protein Lea5-D-like [Carex rostrata]